MVQIRASQVFTHSIDDAVAAKKALDADELFKDVVENIARVHPNNKGVILAGCQKQPLFLYWVKK